MTILIKGGHVINPATQMDEVADVLIKDQKIKKIGKELPEKEAERVINADGCYVMPGFIDMHVHFRDPGFEQKEDIYTGMQAAAHGIYDSADHAEYKAGSRQSGYCQLCAQQSKIRELYSCPAGWCGDKGTAGKRACGY